jgi:acyl-coenzyme A synthetase/AMP-(fatty) acid ligase
VLTYQMLHTEVSRFAAALKKLGLKKGDRVAIYMPMIPEAAIAMLACARLGATHSIVFGGFSGRVAPRPHQRRDGAFVITADGGWRRGPVVPLKATVDTALKETPSIEKVVVVKRTRLRRRDAGRTRPLVGRGRRRRARPSARPSRSTASTRSSSFIRAARPGSRRASSTRRPATCATST